MEQPSARPAPASPTLRALLVDENVDFLLSDVARLRRYLALALPDNEHLRDLAAAAGGYLQQLKDELAKS